MNAVLAIVHIQPSDKIVKAKVDPATTSAVVGSVKDDIKDEKPPLADGQPVSGEIDDDTKPEVKDVDVDEDAGVQGEEEDDMDDEVPYIEDVGTREIAGFIVM